VTGEERERCLARVTCGCKRYSDHDDQITGSPLGFFDDRTPICMLGSVVGCKLSLNGLSNTFGVHVT
jgi:hypothetical protein